MSQDAVFQEHCLSWLRPPRLLDQVRAAIRRLNYSRRTEEAYVHWIKRYIYFHGKRHPNELGEGEATAFLFYLASERKAAAAGKAPWIASSRRDSTRAGVIRLWRVRACAPPAR